MHFTSSIEVFLLKQNSQQNGAIVYILEFLYVFIFFLEALKEQVHNMGLSGLMDQQMEDLASQALHSYS